MSISYLKLKKIAYGCLLLPSLIFVLGFIRWYIALPVTILLVAAYICVLHDTKNEQSLYEEKVIHITKTQFLVLVAVVMVWCFLSGLGNWYYQSDDWSARNAIFRDLIRFDWPVVYAAKDAALVYYIGFWLPPALIGKACYSITADLDVAWQVGNFSLWLWSVICVVLVILMVMVFVNAKTSKRFWVMLAVFVGFSGLDIVGTVINNWTWGLPYSDHIEWWSLRFQYSSTITCLGWVFNQAVHSWMATICFLSEKKVRNYAFIIVLMLSSAPLPAVGLAIYMIGIAVIKLYKAILAKEQKAFLLDVFTPQNVIVVITLLPIYFLYYRTNVALNVGQLDPYVAMYRDWGAVWILIALVVGSLAIAIVCHVKKKSSFEAFFFSVLAVAILLWSVFDLNVDRAYLQFILFESAVYLFLIWKDNRREPLFYLTWILLAICPLITVGTAADFCMRASIPAILILMILCVRYLFDHHGALIQRKFDFEKVTVTLLVVALSLGAITGLAEITRGIKNVINAGYLAVVNDSVYSMSRIFTGPFEGIDRNFIAANYENAFFFRYFAK